MNTNVVIREDGTIYIPEVRLLYPHLEEPWGRNPEDTKKFGLIGLMDKAREKDAKKLRARIAQILADNKFGKLPSDKLFFRDGDDAGRSASEGMWTISASETVRPKCIDGRKRPVAVEDITAMFYSGCWANILINPWVQNNKWGRRVNCNLLAVQFLRDDEPIQGRLDVDTDEVFDSIEEEFQSDDEPPRKKSVNGHQQVDDDDDDLGDDPPPRRAPSKPAARRPAPVVAKPKSEDYDDDIPF